jgi:hypothetical protein
VITFMNMKMLPFQISADPLCNSSSWTSKKDTCGDLHSLTTDTLSFIWEIEICLKPLNFFVTLIDYCSNLLSAFWVNHPCQINYYRLLRRGY